MVLPLDAVDTKLLAALVANARTPSTILAKRAGVSREVVAYRLKRLEERGILLRYITVIDIAKMGYVGAAIFVSTKTVREYEFLAAIKRHPNVSWVGEQVGIWDIGMSLYGRNEREVDALFRELYARFADTIIDYRVTFHKQNHYYYEKLFNKLAVPRRLQPDVMVIDEMDRSILHMLAEDARTDYATLSRKLTLSATAIMRRIKRLETSGHILQYTAFLDYHQLQLYQYSIFIVNKNPVVRNRLLQHLASHAAVCFICEYVGEPFLEFGVFVSDPYDLRGMLQRIEESFPDNRILEMSLQKEVVSYGPPRCVFSPGEEKIHKSQT